MMEAFPFIQQFFTTLQCPHCGAHLQEQGISLIKEENEVFLVHIDCGVCESHVGVAMVGVETIAHGHNHGASGKPSSLSDAIASAIELMERKNNQVVEEFSSHAQDADSDDDDDSDDIIIEAHGEGDDTDSFERLIEAVKSHQSSTANVLKVPHFAGALGLGGVVRRRYRDPELPYEERKRLSKFAPVGSNDVLEAHHFIQDLGKDWMKHIPAEMLEKCSVEALSETD
jgi:hypothetical protein